MSLDQDERDAVFLEELKNEYYTFREEYEHLMQNEDAILTNQRIAFVRKQITKLQVELQKKGEIDV